MRSRLTTDVRPTVTFDGPAHYTPRTVGNIHPGRLPQLWRTTCASQATLGPVLRDPKRGASDHQERHRANV